MEEFPDKMSGRRFVEERLERDKARIESEMAGTDGGVDPFAEAVRATRMPMIIADANQPDYPITFVNDAFCRLTGYGRDEVVGRNCRFLQGPETDPATVAKIREAIAAVRSIEIDIRNYKKSGTPFWNRVLIAPVMDADGKLAYFFSSQFDVTLERERLVELRSENAFLTAEREADQARLNFSEESLRLATDAAEIGTWDLDLTTDVLTWADRTKAMFGISPDAPCSMADFYAGLHPDDRDATAKAFASALDPEQRATYDVEYRTIGKEDGVVRWVAAKGKGLFDSSGRCVRAIGTAIDITERKKSEERLLQSEAELRDLNATLEMRVAEALADKRRLTDVIDNTDIFIQVADVNFNWLAINEAASKEFARIFGVPRPKVGDNMLAALEHLPEHQAAVRAVWSRAIGGEEFLETGEFGDAGHDRRHYEMRFRTLRDPGGSAIGAYQFVYDVTERVREQAKLAEAEEALRQSQKMEAVGQLTGGIAHDFNNLLQAVGGTLDLIRRKPGDAERVKRLADAAMSAAERGSRLTAQLLAFSRVQKMELKPVALTDLVANFRDMIDRTIGAHIRVKLDLRTDGVRVMGDETQIEMAVLNLALNARDAMPDGGDLTIRTKTLRLERDPELAEGDYVELAVSDTGAGMPPAVIARAFDPFFTTKGLGKGTGLGLSQVYGAMRQAGGAVRIESRVGKGTTVRLLLPRTDNVAAEPTQEPIDADRKPVAAHILVVDDDPDVRRFLIECLDMLGFGVVEAEDGYAGLAELERSSPDLMILDFAMPGLNGAEVARRVQETRPGLPIIFVTGFAESAALEAVAGTDAPMLRKPFSLDELQRALDSALKN